MDSIIASVILEFIGASIKWIFNLINSFVRGKERVSFTQIWEGKEGAEYHEILLNGVSNILMGVAFIFAIIFLLIFLNL